MPRTKEDAPSWRDLDYVTTQAAAVILGASRPHIYTMAKAGKLQMVKAETGRTMVSVASIKALLAKAKPYVPDGSDPRGGTRARMQAASELT